MSSPGPIDAVFVPGDPPRTGRVALWGDAVRSDASLPPGVAAGRAGPARPADPGIEARVAWARATSAPLRATALPVAPLPPRHRGEPAPLAVDLPGESGLRGGDLSDLAADAAERAWALCAGDGDGGLTLDPGVDVVRRAAVFLRSPGGPGFAALAARAGQRPADLGRAARAWQIGGADALEVMDGSWPAPRDPLDEGRAALASAGLDQARSWHNRLTVGTAGVQLRLSRSGSWYRFERAGGGWELVDGPQADPLHLLPPHPA